ncbi:MAG TPA: TlpA family protein disulfide reductase [Saprospiraceae bacterium]|nr:TlpA family protein disulfide reductase [Saprospiraceae bacterium]
MFRYFASIVLLSFFSQMSFAAQVTIEGTIKDARQIKEIYLYPDKSFGEFPKQIIPLYQKGMFSIDLDISYPQMAVLGVGGTYLKLYLSPGASILLDADAMIFPSGINFSGDGGEDNYLLQKFYEIDPPVREFDKQYYRIIGHQFPFSTQLEGYMNLYHPDDYRQRLEEKQAKMKPLLEDPHFAKATPDFQRFLRSEIDGFLHYGLLSYALLYAKREKIESNYFHLKPLQDGDINSDYYRNYLILNNLYTASLSEGNNPRAQTCYRLAQTLEQGRAKEYLLSEIIVDAVRKGDEETLMLFEEFLADYPESPFLAKIDKVIYKDISLFYGDKAPDFYLPNMDGGHNTLYQFAGKVIYIDFWASWCKPCLEKLDRLEAAKAKEANSDVVFITISLDGNEQIWKQTLKRRGYTGLHLFAGKSNPVIKDFKVKGIPSEYIIKKDGHFAPAPDDTDPKNLLALLRRLNDK